MEESYGSPYPGDITEKNLRERDPRKVRREARPWPPGTWYDKNGDKVDTTRGWIDPGDYTNLELSPFGAAASDKALKLFEAKFPEGILNAQGEAMKAWADQLPKIFWERERSRPIEVLWPSLADACTDFEAKQKFGRSILKSFGSHVDCDDDLGRALKGLLASLSIEFTVAGNSRHAAAKHTAGVLHKSHGELSKAFKGMMDALRPNTKVFGLSRSWDDLDSIVRWCITSNDCDATEKTDIIRSHDVFPLGQSNAGGATHVHGKPVPDEDATFSICSFNMMDFGISKNRCIDIISEHLKGHDIVVLQELMSPLVCGAYTHGAKKSHAPEPVAKQFHARMSKTHVFSQSRDKTGPSEGPVTRPGLAKGAEFFGIYFNPFKVSVTAQGFINSEVIGKAPHGFRHSHNYTPYVWKLRHLQCAGERTFNVASVHFTPGAEPANMISRQNQLFDVLKFLTTMSVPFIIAGDFNFSSVDEVDITIQAALTKLGADDTALVSANSDGLSTNLFGGKPYDHIMCSKDVSFVPDDNEDIFKVHRFDHTSEEADQYVLLRGQKKTCEKRLMNQKQKNAKLAKKARVDDWTEEQGANLATLDTKFKELKPKYGDHCPVSCNIMLDIA